MPAPSCIPASGEPGHIAITRFLREWQGGDATALDRLTNAVYEELRRLAAYVLGGEGGPRSVEPTILVHELYLQLPDVQHFDWKNRAQFMNTAARMMRHILVDHARRRNTAKRGGGAAEQLYEGCWVVDSSGTRLSVLAVHEALERFAKLYPRQAHVVELRFFGGLSSEETVEVLKENGTECSLRTVERDWTFARAWLQDAIGTA
jgi:RNA polymerase sigma factor (TIGR02999 family)